MEWENEGMARQGQHLGIRDAEDQSFVTHTAVRLGVDGVGIQGAQRLVAARALEAERQWRTDSCEAASGAGEDEPRGVPCGAKRLELLGFEDQFAAFAARTGCSRGSQRGGHRGEVDAAPSGSMLGTWIW